jgi:Holliday junction resolvasome RuvABC endonuclease subunit
MVRAMYRGADPLELILIGIDPGTTQVGLGVMHVSVPDWTVREVSGKTLDAGRLPLDRLIVQGHGERIARLQVIRELVSAEFYRLHPFSVGHESPFYNPRTPGAYGPLVESIVYLRQAAMEYDVRLPFTAMAPTAIKLAMGHGHHGKEGVANALQQLYGQVSRTPIATWQSHATDGLAIAHCLFQQLRNS